MEENKDLKKVRMLYVIIFGLILLILGEFYYFQNKFSEYNNVAEGQANAIIHTSKRINKLVEINHLDEENYKYLVNPNNWNEDLNEQIGMSLDIPENWKIDEVLVKRYNNKTKDDLDEFTITLIKSDDYSFTEFTTALYKKIYTTFGEVYSFNDKDKYYEILSFSEATYNNMYYDYMKTMEDGTTGGPKVKIKVLDQENNKVQIEINKF